MREVLFEFKRVGAYVQVRAIDTQTLVEVSVACPAKAGEQQMKMTALRKLEYVLAKQQG
ncbi:MAG: DUF6898 family protein [Actinomycetota bacterium]